jgi:hypothetical protein
MFRDWGPAYGSRVAIGQFYLDTGAGLARQSGFGLSAIVCD